MTDDNNYNVDLTQNEDVCRAAQDAHDLHNAGTLRKLYKRFGALATTLALEMCVATIMASFAGTFNVYPLLVCMMPVVSAISGNVGLQASSTNVRALAVGILKPSDFVKGIIPEAKAAFAVCCTIGVASGIISLIWYKLHGVPNGGVLGPSNWHDAWVFAFAIWLGMCFAVMTAGISGAFAPIFFKWTKMGDPAALAGPLETAFQDIIGSSVLLALSAAILKAWTYTVDCPCETLAGCLACCQQSSTSENATWVTLNQSCMSNCADLASQQICG